MGQSRRQRLQESAPANHYSELGLNGKHANCAPADVDRLQTGEQLDIDAVAPELVVQIDERTASLRFVVTAAYLPRDAFYRVSVGTDDACASRALLPDADEHDAAIDLARRPSIWGHAPNALYRDAFTNADQFGAYYIEPTSLWRADADGCARVRFETVLGFDELVQRCGAQLASLADGDVAALATQVTLQLFELQIGVHEHQWHAPLALYVDVADSLVLLQQSFDRPSAPYEAPLLLMRDVRIDRAGALGLVLQSSVARESGVLLDMRADPVAHGDEPSFEIDRLDVDAAPRPRDDRMTQDFHLASTAVPAHGVYDGDFLLQFCNSRSTRCNRGLSADHTARLLVRIAAPPHTFGANTVYVNAVQHANDATANDGATCVHAQALGPPAAVQHVRVTVSDAILCASDSAQSIDSGCEGAKHARALLRDGATLHSNVSLSEPGYYGDASSTLCFLLEPTLSDDTGVSVHAERQRLQLRLQLWAGQARTDAHAFVPQRSPFFVLAPLRDTADEATFAAGASLQQTPFARYSFARALAAADAADSSVAIELQPPPAFADMAARDVSVANNDIESAFGLATVLLSILFFAAGLFCVFSARARRTAHGYIFRPIQAPRSKVKVYKHRRVYV